jgi:hypothetical protein
MVNPTIKFSRNDIEQLIPLGSKVIFFDLGTNVLGAGAYKTLKVNGVDYQVPVGKTFKMMAGSIYVTAGFVGKIGSTTAANVGTGLIAKQTTRVNDSTLITPFIETYADSTYVTVYENAGSACSIILTGTTTQLWGIEYDT